MIVIDPRLNVSSQQAKADFERAPLRVSAAAKAPAYDESRAEISPRARAEAERAESQRVGPDSKKGAAQRPAQSDPRLAALVRTIELLTGRSVRVYDARELRAASSMDSPGRAAATPDAGPGNRRGASEQGGLSARGQLRSADGQIIQFRIELNIQRQYSAPVITQQRGAKISGAPLRVNYDGRADTLTDLQFRFDLDADGGEGQLPSLRSGSGLLVLIHDQDRLAELGSDRSAQVRSQRATDDTNRGAGVAKSASADRGVSPGLWDDVTPMRPLAKAGVDDSVTQHSAPPWLFSGAGDTEPGRGRGSSLYQKPDEEAEALQQVDLSV